MKYRVRVSAGAQRQIRRLDPQGAARIRSFLVGRLAQLDHPRQIGTALRSSEPLWRYRAGDYRIIVLIEDDQLIVLVLEVGHRRQVYRR